MTMPYAALIPFLFAVWSLPSSGWAHGGADHAHAPAAPLGEAARRLPDGSLFIPKSMQRRLGVRTRAAVLERHTEAVELAGRVIADPRAASRVEAPQAGRVEAPRAGFPLPGQRVRQGETLAWIVPTLSALDAAEQAARLAALEAEIRLAEARDARLRQLEGVVASKEIEAARIELESLRARRERLVAGIAARVPVRAPQFGVVAASEVRSGQVVAAGQALFELVDPDRLLVEALAQEASLATRVTGAQAVWPQGEAKLRFAGASPALRDLALPMLFSRESGSAPLAVGQTLSVVIATDRILEGVAVPRAAVLRDAGGEPVLWIKLGPERFAPRRVQVRPLDAQRLLVIAGLEAGERVVVDAAARIAQVR